MRSLDLVCHRLAEVVQQRGALRRLDRRLDLRRHDPGQLDDLERVLEDVLAVARAVAEPAEDLHELLVDLAAVRLVDRLLAGLPDVLVELGLRQVVHLLDPRRVDAAVLDQLQQRHPRDLAADAVERREHDGVRRVVDDEVDAGEMLERPDVPTLAADDPALHVVGGKLDDRDGRLGGGARRDPLQRVGDEVPRAPLRLGRSLLLELPHPSGELVADLLLRGGEDPLPRLAGGHAGDPLELGAVAQLELLHLLLQLPEVDLAVGDALLAAGQLGQLPVDVVLLREDALLDLHHRVAPLPELLLELGAQLDRLLARLDRRLPARRVGLAARLVQQQRALAPRGLESRPGHEPQPEKRARSHRLPVRSRLPRQRALAAPRARPARRAPPSQIDIPGAARGRAPRFQVRFSFGRVSVDAGLGD